MADGWVRQVIGPTVDLEFPADALPQILNAIRIDDDERDIHITTEVAQHLGNNLVRCVSMPICTRRRYTSKRYAAHRPLTRTASTPGDRNKVLMARPLCPNRCRNPPSRCDSGRPLRRAPVVAAGP